MRRLLAAAALTVALFAAAGFTSTTTSVAHATCQGTATSPACGGASCSWTGVIPPGGQVNTCYGHWTSGYLTTSGCCPVGTSHTGFILGYTDDRNTDVGNLHIYARYPAQEEAFQMWNRSGNWVWYTVQVG
jgi:hypothetical protein